jgi:predicted RNase H-like nuclease
MLDLFLPETGRSIVADIKSLLEMGVGAVTAIDIPIGLPSDKSRQCDIEATPSWSAQEQCLPNSGS